MKIKITSDSTTDLGSELINKYDITILPLSVEQGGKVFRDGVDIDPDMLYEEYEKSGKLPKTAAPNISEYEDFFRENIEGYDCLIHFSISVEMSSSYNNARIAAEEVGNVYVVDTRNLSTGGGLLVMAAATMREKGMDGEAIFKKLIELTPKVNASFVVGSLELLHKGGRCSTVAMLGANLLKLKPCIEVKDGKMDVGKKYRGAFSKVLHEYIKDRLARPEEIETDYVFVTHAGTKEEIVSACAEEVKSILPSANVVVTTAGCTISSHCGRDTLGVLFINK